MATIKGFKQRFDKLYGSNGEGIKAIITDEVNKSSDELLNLNRDQLLYGRDAEGNVLSPSILEDPYWDDKGGYRAAYNYMVYKTHKYKDFESLMSYTNIQLFPSRNNYTPNLIHSTGSFFFNHFFINVSANSYSIGSTGIAAPDIETKYGKIYGLAPQSKSFYYQHWLRVRLWREIIKHLGKI